MKQEGVNLAVRFQPAQGDGLIVVESRDLPGNVFRCNEVSAQLTEQGCRSIQLKGVLDERIPYAGILKKNSISEKNLLEYLMNELNDAPAQNKSAISKTVDYIQKSLLKSNERTKESAKILNDLVEVYTTDFTWVRDRTLRKTKNGPGSLMSKENITSSPKIAIFKSDSKNTPIPYETVSGFLSVEISEEKEDKTDRIDSLNSRIKFNTDSARYVFYKNKPYLEVDVLSKDNLQDVSFYFHIGKNEPFSPPWSDYEAAVEAKKNKITLRLEISDFATSRYEYTCFAHSRDTQEVVWMSDYGDNKEFTVKKNISSKKKIKSHNQKKLPIPLKNFDSFSRWCTRKRKERGTGALLSSLFSDSESRNKISEYYEESLRRLSRRNSVGAYSVVEMVRTLGLSSITMVTPEGPHAIAGGLSQVIVGLSESLSNEGLDVNIISPIYEELSGNHHTSFYNAVKNGLSLFGETCFPELKGEIFVNVPGTSWEHSHTPATPRRVIRVEVFELNSRNIRMLFLRHKNLGDRLYGGISAKDQIVRSIFLSRGSIEVCRQEIFGITPGIIVTHDWLPSLVSPLLELDKDYLQDERLRSFKPIHMLHNVGRAYQGKFHQVENGENLWDLIGLDKEHLFGFLDEEDRHYLNFTKASCFHNKNAIITVSKPYADQLLQDSSGEGLTKTLNSKKGILFGISNGIPQKAVRAAGFKRVQNSIMPKVPDSIMSLDEVIEAKKKLKLKIQQENNLIKDPSSVLAVFVGRLTEQKGLGLLSACLDNNVSLIENALEKYPELQIIVAGPPSKNDQAFVDFDSYYKILKSKYPGRCSNRFEFVPHSYAIELTAAADMFLMPSKYEPGGITQLEALAVGTTVVAHRVGGISATLSSFKQTSGNSFLFDSFCVNKFWESLQSACDVLGDSKKSRILVERALIARNDWENRVPYYLSLFQKSTGIFDIFTPETSSFASSRLELLKRISAESK